MRIGFASDLQRGSRTAIPLLAIVLALVTGRPAGAASSDPEAPLDRSLGAQIDRARLDPGITVGQRDLMARSRVSTEAATPRRGMASIDGAWDELPPPGGR